MENHIKYSKGVCWISDCRIPFVDEGDMKATTEAKYSIGDGGIQSELGFGTKKIGNVSKETGRFTPNLLVCDDMLNDGVVGGNNSNKFYEPQYEDTSNIYGKYKKLQVSQYKDKGTNSRYYDLDKWFDKIVDNL